MNLNEFNDYYVKHVLDKLSKENKNIFHLGDFKIDSLNYDQQSPTLFFPICSCLILYNQQEKEIIPKH